MEAIELPPKDNPWMIFGDKSIAERWVIYSGFSIKSSPIKAETYLAFGSSTGNSGELTG